MERIVGRLDVDGIKRMQMPETTIIVKCGKCGNEYDIPLVDQIYYPGDSNESHHIAIECEKCETETMRKIDIVSIVVTLDVHDAEIV